MDYELKPGIATVLVALQQLHMTGEWQRQACIALTPLTTHSRGSDTCWGKGTPPLNESLVMLR